MKWVTALTLGVILGFAMPLNKGVVPGLCSLYKPTNFLPTREMFILFFKLS